MGRPGGSTPLLITEGEKKALALLAYCRATKSDYLPVALPGVWNFRGVVGKVTADDGSRQDVRGVIPDLDRVNWRGRQVLIIFDSNVNVNPSVNAARQQLTRILMRRGRLSTT
jgi:hypothetical protein